MKNDIEKLLSSLNDNKMRFGIDMNSDHTLLKLVYSLMAEKS